MIAALYARYSSDSQREESIVAQLRAGREYCKRRGYTIIHEYADEAMTGTNDSRPGFRQMMSDAQKGLFEVVVSHKIDRIGRNEYEYYTNKFKLNGWGVNIEFSAQQIDTSTPEGALMENQLAGLAAYYSRNLSKEVKKGLKENALSGRATGGRPLFGYNYNKDKTYAIDENEAIAVRYIFKAYLEGSGYLPICHWLNVHGYKTKRGNPFGKNSLHDLLKNRRYIGTAILGKNHMTKSGRRNNHRPDPENMLIVENVCPAIIDKETFRKVADKMESNRRRSGSYKAKHSYLLSGLLECGNCGQAMVGTVSTKKNGQTNYYYRCGKKGRQGAAVCTTRNVPADALDRLVLAQISQLFFSPEALEKISDKVVTAYKEQMHDSLAQEAALHEQEKVLRKKLNNLYGFIEDGTADDFDRQRLAETKKELLSISTALAEVENSSIPDLPKSTIMEYIERYRADLDAGTADNLKALVNAFIEKILITSDKITVRYRFAFTGALGQSRTAAFSSGG